MPLHRYQIAELSTVIPSIGKYVSSLLTDFDKFCPRCLFSKGDYFQKKITFSVTFPLIKNSQWFPGN